ncbi:EpsG family protein [Mycolicibacterium fluoranthenivorans]|uniref:EpsG family protein n=1 Tax=Mycolicibacterium fluoranthenivorans TaxID=258505 RepID=A0A7X5TVS1_9MYCO|nr:EpsG family protein [Mycolicibacterium fluoranthenivorans]MCV7359271.1 EpsG family protein [Mycolicibacterium fluoranthenivorans]NIH93645.1 hypothetical protein [Mycolicibacterium fluoranthenivorans]
MIVYGVAALLSMILASALNVRSWDQIDVRRPLVYIPLLPFLAVAVLRSGVGKDTVGEWSTYPRIFEFVESGHSYSDVFSVIRIEPLYYALNWAVTWCGGDAFVIYAIMSAIFLIFMYRFIIEKSTNVPLSLLLLFASDLYMFALTGIRQAAACGIAFYALKYAQSRQPSKYFAWIAVATGFHFTALVFVLLYFFTRRRVTPAGVTILILTGIALALSPGIVREFNSIYYGAVYFGSKWDYSNFNLVPTLITTFVALAALIQSRKIVDRDPSMQLFINITLVNCFLMAISSLLITPIRLYYLFIPAAFVLVPAILESIPYGRQRELVRPAVGAILIAILSLQMVYEVSISNDAYGTWSYQWVFGKETNA